MEGQSNTLSPPGLKGRSRRSHAERPSSASIYGFDDFETLRILTASSVHTRAAIQPDVHLNAQNNLFYNCLSNPLEASASRFELRADLLSHRDEEFRSRQGMRERRQKIRTLCDSLARELQSHSSFTSCNGDTSIMLHEFSAKGCELVQQIDDYYAHEDSLNRVEARGEELREGFFHFLEAAEESTQPKRKRPTIRHESRLELLDRLKDEEEKCSAAVLQLQQMEDDDNETSRREQWWRRINIPDDELQPAERLIRMDVINKKKEEIEQLRSCKLRTQYRLELLHGTA